MAEEPVKSGCFGGKALTPDVGPALHAVTDGERDNLKLLTKFNSRMEKVGVTLPGIEVRWDNLMVEVKGPKAATAKGSFFSRSKMCGKPQLVLNAGSGVLPPGRMCLLLGPPGAGRTTLLRALSGQLLTARAGLQLYGNVSYNGQPIRGPGCGFEVARAATYVGQRENHLAELTVAETLTFAARCQGGGATKRMHDLIREREAAAGLSSEDEHVERLMGITGGPHAPLVFVEMVARMLGIDHVMDTPVGDEMLKGISGGQQRRVTFGEMAVGLAQVMMLDEVTNGLDAASALALVRALRNSCDLGNTTVLATLLQPSSEVVECFDDVMLLAAGTIVFHGPRDDLLPFFASLGLRPLPAQTMADFAQEVAASPEDQAKYRESSAGGVAAATAGGRKWISPRRIRKAFDASECGRKLAALVATPPYTHPLQDLVLHSQRYGLSAWPMLLALMRREALLFARNPLFFMAGIVQVLFIAFLVSTAFVNLGRKTFNDANLFLAVIFFSLTTVSMSSFNFIPIFVKRLPVFYKQRDHGFYTPAAYAIACCAVRLPELALQAAAYIIMVYFSVGFTADAGRFFLFLLNLFAIGFNNVTLCQMLAAFTRNDVATQGLAAVSLMVNVLVSGFPIARTSIHGWWIWLYWLLPTSWTFRSLAATEMTSPDWPAEQAGGQTVAEYALVTRGFYKEWFWVWAGIGYVVGVSLVQLGITIAALTWLGPVRGISSGPELDEDEEDHLGTSSRLAHSPTTGNLDDDPVPLQAQSRAVPAVNGDDVRQTRGVRQQDANEDGSRRAGVLQLAAVAPGSAGPSPLQQGRLPADAVAVDVRGAGGGAGQGGGDAEGGLVFTPVVMAFTGVCYDVPDPSDSGKKLRLLSDVSGVFRPGVLTCLMGASGAGKTTLMDVLAGRKTGGHTEGVQVVNGQPKRMGVFARLMGYVEQQDVHCPYTTVEEALLFSARLRVEPGVLPPSPGALKAFVRRMMDVVELGPLADRQVGMGGGGGGGLSTEARKRLTIAVELVANPSVVFMDEPTTGLDARAASLVMRTVRNTVSTGRTVVCTIHQPNREIMDYFDELLLLKPGGRVIFFGALGPRQASLVAHLSSSVPGVPSYEPHMNPANWMLEVTSPSMEETLGVDFATVWAESEGARVAEQLIQLHMLDASAAPEATTGRHVAGRGGAKPPGAASSGTTPADVESAQEARAENDAIADEQLNRFSQPTLVQLRVVLGRALMSQWRNSAYNGMRFAITAALALVLGTLYWGAGRKRDSLVGVLDIMGVMYGSSVFLSMVNFLMVMPAVAADRAIFYRERASGMYRGAVFAAAQGVAEMPFLFAQSVLYVVILYGMIQFEFTGTKILWFWLYMWLDLQFFTFMGMGVMNATPNLPTATASASFFVLLWMLFCGFLIYRKNIKPWYIWAYYANPMTFIIYGCVATQLGNVTDGFITVGDSTATISQYIKDTFSYEYDMRGYIVLILVGFIVVCRCLSYLGLTRMNFQRR